MVAGSMKQTVEEIKKPQINIWRPLVSKEGRRLSALNRSGKRAAARTREPGYRTDRESEVPENGPSPLPG